MHPAMPEQVVDPSADSYDGLASPRLPYESRCMCWWLGSWFMTLVRNRHQQLRSMEPGAFSVSLLSMHMDRYSTPLTFDWYTLRRRLHSPTGKTGLIIFWVFIISLNSEKL